MELTNEQSFEVKISTSVFYNGIGDVNVDLFLGRLQSNEYQEARPYANQDSSQLQVYGFAEDSCYFYSIKLGKKTDSGKRTNLEQNFEIKAYDVHVNLENVDSIFPYDTASDIYKNFTKSNSPFIETENESLQKIADSIWL